MRVDYPGDVGENDLALPSIPTCRRFNRGPVAQLGARFHGMEEVVGSIPTRSTNSHSPLQSVLIDGVLTAGPVCLIPRQ